MEFDGFDFAAIPRPQRVERALAVDALVRVRTEEVALSLDERSRQTPGPQTVVIGKRRGEHGSRKPRGGCVRDAFRLGHTPVMFQTLVQAVPTLTRLPAPSELQLNYN